MCECLSSTSTIRWLAPHKSNKSAVTHLNNHLLRTTARTMQTKVTWEEGKEFVFRLSRLETWPSSARIFPETAGLSSCRLEYVGTAHTAVTPRMKPLRHTDVPEMVQCHIFLKFKWLSFWMIARTKKKKKKKNFQSHVWYYSSEVIIVADWKFYMDVLQIYELLKCLMRVHASGRLANV